MGVSGNLSQEVCAESHYAQDQHVPRDTHILYFPLMYMCMYIYMYTILFMCCSAGLICYSFFFFTVNTFLR